MHDPTDELIRILIGTDSVIYDKTNRPYARETKLTEFDIKKSGLKSYLENLEGKPGNHEVQEKSWVFTQNMTHQQQRMEI